MSVECLEQSSCSRHYGSWEYQCLPYCVTSGISVRTWLPSTCFSLGLGVSLCTCAALFAAKDSGSPCMGFWVSLCFSLLSSTLPCWLQPLGQPTCLVFLFSRLGLGSTSLCCGLESPQAEGQSERGFHLLQGSHPCTICSLVTENSCLIYFVEFYCCLWWVGKSDIPYSVMRMPQVTL